VVSTAGLGEASTVVIMIFPKIMRRMVWPFNGIGVVSMAGLGEASAVVIMIFPKIIRRMLRPYKGIGMVSKSVGEGIGVVTIETHERIEISNNA
jgi:N-acyl-L-homoserine lactone synthetase